jgi:hypothetical protein
MFGLTVPVLLLGVGVQGVRGQMPRRHLPVCALLQEQGLLLAPAGERVWTLLGRLLLLCLWSDCPGRSLRTGNIEKNNDSPGDNKTVARTFLYLRGARLGTVMV